MCLLQARYCAKPYELGKSLSSFYTWGTWWLDRLTNLTKILKIVRIRAGVQIQDNVIPKAWIMPAPTHHHHHNHHLWHHCHHHHSHHHDHQHPIFCLNWRFWRSQVPEQNEVVVAVCGKDMKLILKIYTWDRIFHSRNQKYITLPHSPGNSYTK